MASVPSDHPARAAWGREVIRLRGHILTDTTAYAVQQLAEQVFREYDAEAAALRTQRDTAYAVERKMTSELRAEIARLTAEADEARGAQSLYCVKSGIIEAMEASVNEPEGTIMRATDEQGLAFVLGGDKLWRRL